MKQLSILFLICSIGVVNVFGQDVISWGSAANGLSSVPASAHMALRVAGGSAHAVALLTDGHVVTWGDNSAQQLAMPSGLAGIRDIAAGDVHTVALTGDGHVVCWGGLDVNVITPPAALRNVFAVAAGAGHSVALKANGTVVSWGSAGQPYWQVPAGIHDVIAIAAGDRHTVALLANGTVQVWGENAHHQLDVPSGLANVVAVAAGSNHTVALTADGRLVVWGDNDPSDGDQLTLPTNADHVTAIAAKGGYSLALRSDGTLVGWGDNTSGQRTLPARSDIIGLAVGTGFGLAITSDKLTARAWGSNFFNSNAIPPGLHAVKDIRQGLDFSTVLLSNGTVQSFGRAPRSVVPTGIADVKQISNGIQHTSALLADGTARIWGESIPGVFQPTVPAGLHHIKALACHSAATQTMALLADGSVTVWGHISGRYAIPASYNHAIRSIASGANHTLVVYADGSVRGFGLNTYGQLNGVDTLTNVIAVAGGSKFSAVLRADGTFLAWGDLGTGVATPLRGANVRCLVGGYDMLLALQMDGSPLGFGSPRGDELILLPAAKKIYALAAGLRDVGIITAELPAAVTPLVADVDVYESVPPLAWPPVQLNPPLTISGNLVISMVLQQSDPLDLIYVPGVVSPGTACLSGPCISITRNNSTGTILLSGEATASDYQNILSNLGFMHRGNDWGSVHTITVNVDDGLGLSPAATLRIHLIAANHAPSFVKGADIQLLEDAPLSQQTFAGWATAISAGPVREPNQALTFMLTSDNPALFAIAPSIDPASGTLSFKLADNANGVAHVTIVLKDNGGTTGGGIDESASQNFQITVTPVNDAPSMTTLTDVTIPNHLPWPINLSGITAGPSEDDQTVTLTVASDPTQGVAATVTYVSGATGNVTLTPAPGFSGTLQITIHLRDNGGTASGGVDQRDYTFNFTVLKEDDVYIPTTFSPNNDGVNDVFRVRSARIASVHFAVYTLAGNKIFSTEDVNIATQIGWNGLWQGAEVPVGTYVWVLSGLLVDGESLTFHGAKSGQVLLVR